MYPLVNYILKKNMGKYIINKNGIHFLWWQTDRIVEIGQRKNEGYNNKESEKLNVCHWPARLSSVCLCCPGASPTNTTSFLKWPIPEKGNTRSRPPSSSANDGSAWASTAAALKGNIHMNMHNTNTHTSIHDLMLSLSLPPSHIT